MSGPGRALRLLGGSGRQLAQLRKASGYPTAPLTEPLDLATPPRDAGSLAESLAGGGKEARITQLENGLRVASQEAFGQYSTIGGELVEIEEGVR